MRISLRVKQSIIIYFQFYQGIYYHENKSIEYKHKKVFQMKKDILDKKVLKRNNISFNL